MESREVFNRAVVPSCLRYHPLCKSQTFQTFQLTTPAIFHSPQVSKPLHWLDLKVKNAWCDLPKKKITHVMMLELTSKSCQVAGHVGRWGLWEHPASTALCFCRKLRAQSYTSEWFGANILVPSRGSGAGHCVSPEGLAAALQGPQTAPLWLPRELRLLPTQCQGQHNEFWIQFWLFSGELFKSCFSTSNPSLEIKDYTQMKTALWLSL
jgi:hypothetical protein